MFETSDPSELKTYIRNGKSVVRARSPGQDLLEEAPSLGELALANKHFCEVLARGERRVCVELLLAFDRLLEERRRPFQVTSFEGEKAQVIETSSNALLITDLAVQAEGLLLQLSSPGGIAEPIDHVAQTSEHLGAERRWSVLAVHVRLLEPHARLFVLVPNPPEPPQRACEPQHELRVPTPAGECRARP